MSAKPLLILMIIFLSLMFFSCDDQAPSSDFDGSGDDDDDDTTTDDDDDDDDDTTVDDDDDDNDDDDDVHEIMAMRPVDLDGNSGKEVLVWWTYEDDGTNWTTFDIYDTTGHLLYSHPPVDVGPYGAAQYRIGEFDGVSPAEIIVTYQHIEIDHPVITYTGWAEVLRGPDFLTIASVGPVLDALVWNAPDIDLNDDGLPEWTVEVRPVEPTVEGRMEIIDIANQKSFLTINAGFGEGVEVLGKWDLDYMSPAPITGLPGNYFLTAFRTLIGDGHVEIYLRDAQAPDAPGTLLEETDLAFTSAYTMTLVDHDNDGDFDPFFLFNEDTGARYNYRDFYFGNLTDCTSYNSRFADDLDGDQIADLVLTAQSCQSAKGDIANAIFHFSSQNDLPVKIETSGPGSLYPFWNSPGYSESGLAPIHFTQGDQFAVFAIDSYVANSMEINLFGPGNPTSSVWSSGELAPNGIAQYAGGKIADFDGDGLLDIAAYAIAYIMYGGQPQYNSNIYLLIGKDLVDIASRYKYTDEYWKLGSLWDFDGDNVADLLLERYRAGNVASPKILLVSPKNDFSTIFELEDNSVISMGIIGRYF